MKAFALGGGGGKIGFSAGAVYELSRQGIRPDVISGISSGGLVGIMTATGQLDELKTILLEEVTNDRVYRKRGVRYVWRYGLHKAGLRNPLQGLYSNEPLKELIHSMIFRQQVHCDYYCGAVDLETFTFHHVYIPRGSILAGRQYDRWLHAILATTAIPVYFQPVVFKGLTMVDGGIHYHTPFKPLQDAVARSDVKTIYAVSMQEDIADEPVKITTDLDKLARVIRGMIDRQANGEINEYLRMNEVARRAGGHVELLGKVFKYYDGAVIRPTQKLNDSLDFNYENMREDFAHGRETAAARIREVRR